jgi:rhodanese-related sulfurtransferase
MPKPGTGFLGDVSVEEAWDTLKATSDAMLIDVRTVSEWAYVGVPLLEAIGKSPIFVEWQTFPAGNIAGDFVTQVASALEKRGAGKDAPILFICRSGTRSRSAALAMASAGYGNCFNIGPGFEGPLDGDGHRNSVSGWRMSGLPWSQT